MTAAPLSAKAWCYARRGPISEVLKLKTVDFSAVPEDAVVQVLKAPIHRTDTAIINGTALGRTKGRLTTMIGGCEGVGKVVSAGKGNDRFREGDTVWIAPLQGCWAERIAVNPAMCHKILPAHTDLAVSASCLLAAEHMLEGYARLDSAMDAIVQNGGSSLVALAVSALAQDRKIPVLTAATPGPRFAAAAARHKTYGSEIFEYNPAGRRKMEAALQKDKRSAALFLNGVGGPNFSDFCKLLGHKATAVNYGAQCGFGLSWASGPLVYKSATISSLYLPNVLQEMSYEQRQARLDGVLTTLAAKRFTYPVEIISALDKFPELWDSLYIKGGAKGILSF